MPPARISPGYFVATAVLILALIGSLAFASQRGRLSFGVQAHSSGTPEAGGGGSLGSGVPKPGDAAIVASCPGSRPDGTAVKPWTPSPQPNSLPAVGERVPEMSTSHVAVGTVVRYNHNPPTSGCHYSTSVRPGAPVRAGLYSTVIPREYWVHNLEHGYIVVLYNCPTGCAADLEALNVWYGALPADRDGTPYAKVLVLPYTEMAPHIAMVSFNWYDHIDGPLDVGAVQKFYLNHVGNGPEHGS